MTKEEKDKYLYLLERDYAVFTIVQKWIEQYVPVYETSVVTSELLENQHIAYDMRNAVETGGSGNILNIQDYRNT